jgi:hypothetical protein
MSDQAPGLPDGRSQRERMLAGELYIADDHQLLPRFLITRGCLLRPGFGHKDDHLMIMEASKASRWRALYVL